jgi:hypothetical protein
MPHGVTGYAGQQQQHMSMQPGSQAHTAYGTVQHVPQQQQQQPQVLQPHHLSIQQQVMQQQSQQQTQQQTQQQQQQLLLLQQQQQRQQQSMQVCICPGLTHSAVAAYFALMPHSLVSLLLVLLLMPPAASICSGDCTAQHTGRRTWSDSAAQRCSKSCGVCLK